MKRKGKKGRKKKRAGKQAAKIFGFLVLIGVGVFVLIHFRQEIGRVLNRPFEETSPPPRSVPSTKPSPIGKKKVFIYFSDEEGQFLIGERREIPEKATVVEEAKAVMIELTRGPKGKLIPTLPDHTKVLTLQVDKGTARVNFDRTFIRGHPGGSSAEIMTVYSVVNSLALNFPEIRRVQFLVEGETVKTIKGHLSLMEPFLPKRSLIKQAAPSR